MTAPSGELRAFLSAWVRSPATIGAVAPSSRRLAEQLASLVPDRGRPVVVELGSGTGAITNAIEQRLPAGASHVAIDANPAMVSYLHRRCPGVQALVGDARQLGVLLAEHSIRGADAVISGLPWALFTPTTQHAVLSQVASVLRPGGVFATFAYLPVMLLPTAQQFRRRLHDCFHDVTTTPTVWGNVPPAFCYVCRRPR
ncbi:MAG: SAM-dependent methyltransferase [Pseudonocardia sp.]|nr:SAM-dependent methyltransferase [Pseudonocardia sp.]